MDANYLEAAEMVANPLFEGERALDTSIAHTARLIAAMADASVKAGVNPRVGHSALAKTAQAMAAQVEARSAIIAAHRLLAKHRSDYGLDSVGFGDESECPPMTPPPSGELVPLRVAA